MSGGHFEYKQYNIAEQLYGYGMSLSYGQDGFDQSKKAAKLNPFHDVEISEMFWDMLVLVQSLDWYESGDNGLFTYSTDVDTFKEKWFGKTDKDRAKHIIDNCLETARDDIYQAMGIPKPKEGK